MTEDQSRLEKNLIEEDIASLEYVQLLSLGMKIFEYLDPLGLDSWNSSSYKTLNITSFRSYASTAVNQLGHLTWGQRISVPCSHGSDCCIICVPEISA